MVDRYTIRKSRDDLQGHTGLAVPEMYTPRYNAAPTQFLPIITAQGNGGMQMYQWGLISSLANNKKLSPRLFNLPLESALSRPSYRKSLISNRCMIPIDGFYVWKQIAKKKSTPYYIYAPGAELFYVAGVWEVGDPFAENPAKTFMLITTDSNSEIATYQEDMPLILDNNIKNEWLSSSNSIDYISDLLEKNTRPEFKIHAVSPLITKIELDLEEMTRPSSPSDQHGNYTLFG